MTQVEIAYQNILTVVALYQAMQESLTDDDRDMLMVSLRILGEGAGLSVKRIAEIAEDVRQEAKNVRNAEEN